MRAIIQVVVTFRNCKVEWSGVLRARQMIVAWTNFMCLTMHYTHKTCRESSTIGNVLVSNHHVLRTHRKGAKKNSTSPQSRHNVGRMIKISIHFGPGEGQLDAQRT